MIKYASHIPCKPKKRGEFVWHKYTCSVCGQTRVRLYKRGEEWKCEKCKEVAQKGENDD